MSLLAGLWARVSATGAAIFSIVAVIITTLIAARRSGRVEAERDTLQRSIDAERKAHEAGNDFRGDGAVKRLRDGTF